MTENEFTPEYLDWLADFFAHVDMDGPYVAARQAIRAGHQTPADFGDYNFANAISEAAWAMQYLEEMIVNRRSQIKGEFA